MTRRLILLILLLAGSIVWLAYDIIAPQVNAGGAKQNILSPPTLGKTMQEILSLPTPAEPAVPISVREDGVAKPKKGTAMRKSFTEGIARQRVGEEKSVQVQIPFGLLESLEDVREGFFSLCVSAKQISSGRAWPRYGPL